MDTDKAWTDNPNVIREFLSRRPIYEELCVEVVYLLRRRLEEAGVLVAGVTSRTKSLESFLEKLQRKKYGDPGRVTDLAGTRIVCLFKSDLPLVEDIVKREFEVVERVDKTADLEIDRFGYEGVHFLATLKAGNSGARYDHLRNLVCEIQTRTLAQDVWAVIDHHLLYKQEASVPKELRRQLHGLAGLFETADNQFDQIRAARESYLSTVRASSADPKTSTEELNLDSLRAFCRQEFRTHEAEEPKAFTTVFSWLVANGYTSVNHLAEVVAGTRERLRGVMVALGPAYQTMWTDLFCLHVSVAIANPRYRNSSGLAASVGAAIDGLDQKQTPST